MNTELATQNQLQEVVVSGSEILKNAELRVSKALSVGEKLINEITENGMNAELDERANKFLVNCRNAKAEIENQRKPITAFFDQIRKQFTETEGKLDTKKADTYPAKLQAQRDAYVKKIREEEDAKAKAAQIKLDKEKEVIDVRTSIDSQLSLYVQGHVTARKQKLQASFNGITLETFEAKSAGLKSLKTGYTKEDFNAFVPKYENKLLSKEECDKILADFMSAKDFELISAVVVDDIKKFTDELIDKLPSLKTSLDEMAKAGEEEQKKLAEAKAEREKADAEKIKTDAEAKAKAEAEALELKRVADKTNAMMDNVAIPEMATPETRDGFKINILNHSGIAEMFAFWLQKEGINLSIEEIEKKTITQMKAFCEKTGHKTGDVIVSENLKYEPVYKAVNRK
jgi:hypothetical protein